MITGLHAVLSNNPSLVRLPPNTSGRDWFVGDVHGEFAMLHRALAAAKFDPAKDRLIGVGDLVDRGPQSFETLEFFARQPWAVSTLGNHEVMALRGILGASRGYLSREIWRCVLTRQQQREAVRFIEQMPIALEVPLADGRVIGVVHAELPPQAPWSVVEKAKVVEEEFHDESESALLACLLWSRRHFQLALSARYDPRAKTTDWEARLRAALLLLPIPGVDLVIAGHSVLEADFRPLQAANRLWIDTGSGYRNGRLTLINPLDGLYVQVHEQRARQYPFPAPLDLSRFVLPVAEVQGVMSKARAAGRERELLFQKE
jgi:serine/threonine protein phosphatase 1